MPSHKVKYIYFNNTKYNLIIKQSNIDYAGLGLFLDIHAEPILKNVFLGYYFGYWNYDNKKQSNCSYYINKRICIDVNMENRPYTSIMNDAYRTDFTNNIISKIAVDENVLKNISKKNCDKYDSNKIIKLYTTKDILPGMELFFDYGENYWKSW
jgi:SET domain-containing protein